MKRYSKKALENRKEERKDFPEFFQRHIQNIIDNRLCCEECGSRLIGDVSEVAHILPKQTYKSVSTLDENVIYLCGWKQNNCHANFDNGSTEFVHNMKVFPLVSDRFMSTLVLEVKEKLNWKINDRYIK